MGSKESGKKLRNIIRSLAKRLGDEATPLPAVLRRGMERFDHLLAYLLCRHMSAQRAAKLLAALNTEFLDYNELRIARRIDVQAIFSEQGADPAAAIPLQAFLNQVYPTLAHFELESLAAQGEDLVAERLSQFRKLDDGLRAYLWALMGQPLEEPQPDEATVRILKRMGLLGKKTGPQKVGKTVDAIMPESERTQCHFLLLAHARLFCTADKPRCGDCPVNRECEHYRKVVRPKLEKAERGVEKSVAQEACASRPT